MKGSVNTNVRVHTVVCDDAAQSKTAAQVMTHVTLIAVTLLCLCEFVWVLRKIYGFQALEITTVVGALLSTANVRANRPAAEAGLEVLEASGNFADGVIAHKSRWLGGETFISFDKKTVSLLIAHDQSARLLSA